MEDLRHEVVIDIGGTRTKFGFRRADSSDHFKSFVLKSRLLFDNPNEVADRLLTPLYANRKPRDFDQRLQQQRLQASIQRKQQQQQQHRKIRRGSLDDVERNMCQIHVISKLVFSITGYIKTRTGKIGWSVRLNEFSKESGLNYDEFDWVELFKRRIMEEYQPHIRDEPSVIILNDAAAYSLSYFHKYKESPLLSVALGTFPAVALVQYDDKDLSELKLRVFVCEDWTQSIITIRNTMRSHKSISNFDATAHMVAAASSSSSSSSSENGPTADAPDAKTDTPPSRSTSEQQQQQQQQQPEYIDLPINEVLAKATLKKFRATHSEKETKVEFRSRVTKALLKILDQYFDCFQTLPIKIVIAGGRAALIGDAPDLLRVTIEREDQQQMHDLFEGCIWFLKNHNNIELHCCEGKVIVR